MALVELANLPQSSASILPTDGVVTQTSALGSSLTSVTLLAQSLAPIISVSSINLIGSIPPFLLTNVPATAIVGNISANQIGGVNASLIIGSISASQIGSVNAGAIVGNIQAGQIVSINATQIAGQISAGQIGSVNASAITGAVQSNQINTINASQIAGSIQAAQIATVSASSIVGSISFGQVESVNAASIQGLIQANQISSLTATQITGVIVTNQLQSQILNTLGLIGGNLSVVQTVASLPSLPSANYPAGSIVIRTGDSTLWQVSSGGGTWASATASSVLTGALTATDIASVNATAITGLIIAAQIGSVAATTITGQIVSTQISSVSASTITGSIQSNQISSITAGQITGSITATTLSGSITASQITGSIQAGQIATVAATQITGSITSTQIGSVSAAVITGSIQSNQIASIAATQITGSIQSNQIGTIPATQITGTISAGQIGSVAFTQITGTISAGQLGSVTAAQIASVNASAITGTLSAAQIGSVNASSITGNITSSQIGSVAAGSITIGLIGDSQIGSVSAGKLVAGSEAIGVSLTVGSGLNQFTVNSAGINFGGMVTMAQYASGVVAQTFAGTVGSISIFAASSSGSSTASILGFDAAGHQFLVLQPTGFCALNQTLIARAWFGGSALNSPSQTAFVLNAQNNINNTTEYGLFVGTNWASTENIIAQFANVNATTGALTNALVIRGDMTSVFGGQVTAPSFNSTSTRASKSNIRGLDRAAEIVRQLRAVVYDRTDGSRMGEVGFVAEEVDAVLPGVVGHTADGRVSGLDYGRFTPVLAAALGEVEREIRGVIGSLDARLRALEGA